MATIPEAAIIEAAAAISEQLTDGLGPGERARRWQEQAACYRRAARAGLVAALPHMQARRMAAVHETLLYGLRLGSLGSYVLAIAVACLAIAVRSGLSPFLQDVPYLPYIPAVLLAGFYCGTRPGLLTVGLCGLFSWAAYIPRASSWDIARLSQGRGLIPYLIVASFCTVIMGLLRRALDGQRQAETRQAILIAELQHRTRNLLSIVRAVSERTVSNSASLDEFSVEYADRLAAIGRVQNLLWEERDLDLETLIWAELSAHGAEARDPCISAQGPRVALPARGMHILALAIHELATNSLKYGALSQPEATLVVAWEFAPGGHGNLILVWDEHGVRMPPDRHRSKEGFGRQLIERALRYELKASTSFDLAADGARCRIEIPVDRRA
jgi:two-component sensor histidine kinase